MFTSGTMKRMARLAGSATGWDSLVATVFMVNARFRFVPGGIGPPGGFLVPVT
jgi:hypothetical protein